MRVENMVSNKGNKIANQFIIMDVINGDKYEYFQSYDTIIVKSNITTGKIQLDANAWNYSRTTSKYRSLFLGETTKETEQKIKSGVYSLENLN
jgi:hypothetical protein